MKRSTLFMVLFAATLIVGLPLAAEIGYRVAREHKTTWIEPLLILLPICVAGWLLTMADKHAEKEEGK